MNESTGFPIGAAQGRIRRRLLVNAVVDPDEAASRLPAGLRPHVTTAGTVIGCCLLEIESIRPAGAPAFAGRGMRAAAHRISIDWEDEAGNLVVGVYVPMRQTDSRLAIALGGRTYPGVHERARIEVSGSNEILQWSVDPSGPQGYPVRVRASVPAELEPTVACEPVAGACVRADVGLSPDRRGELEGARMEPDHRRTREVAIDDLDSAFLSSFSTAEMAPSYLMADVDVRWTRADVSELADSRKAEAP